MSGRRRFICHNGFHRATRLCLRAFDAMKLMTSGASPIAQMSGAVSKDRRPSRLRTSTRAGTVVALYWRARRAPMAYAHSVQRGRALTMRRLAAHIALAVERGVV